MNLSGSGTLRMFPNKEFELDKNQTYSTRLAIIMALKSRIKRLHCVDQILGGRRFLSSETQTIVAYVVFAYHLLSYWQIVNTFDALTIFAERVLTLIGFTNSAQK